MTILTHDFTREHSLFYFYVWRDCNQKDLKKWIGRNIKNILFLREGKSNRATVWYDPEETENWFKTLINKCNEDKMFIKKVIKSFFEHWDFLFPYIKEEKNIKSLDELKEFYQHWVEFWSPMAIIFTIPKIEEIPQEQRDDALIAREKTQEYSEYGDQIFINFFTKNYPEYADIVNVISPEEIFQLKSKKLSAEEHEQIRKRLSGFALLNNKLLLLEELDEQLAEQNIILEKIDVVEVKELKGTIAMKGKVTGKVKLILYKKQIPELQEGEILITENTEPSFLPAIKKAAAIVTDEGGVTSHAAIISRELGKPCIIGTKSATKVFKDGDTVEVDATKGTIKKIS